MLFNIDPLTARAIKKYPHRTLDIVQSLDEKQIICKNWLIEKLEMFPIEPKRIWIAGGWFGNLMIPSLRMLYGPDPIIRLHDLDEEVLHISRTIFFPKEEHPNTFFDVQDSTQFQYKKDIVINTSCEHMAPLKTGKALCVLQSNNYYGIEGHTHCVSSTKELIEMWNLKKVLYEGKIEFPKYERYMVIGYGADPEVENEEDTDADN
jgi:hypothetical protein